MYCCTCGYPLFGLPDTTCPVVLLAALVFGLVVVSAVGFVWTRVLWR